MHLRMEVRVCSESISSSRSSSAIIVPSRYSEFETADGERKPLGGCGTGGGGKPYRKLWEWVDGGDGIRVIAAVVQKGVQEEEGRRKILPAARTEGRRTGKKAAAANGKGKRKSEAEEERGRPSAGGPHRCGARRGQSAAA